MFKNLIRPAKVFGLHGLPMQARLARQEGGLQSFVALFGGRYESKEMILQRIQTRTTDDADLPTAHITRWGAAPGNLETSDDQDIDGPYPVCLRLTRDGAPYWFDNIRGEFWRCFSLSGNHHGSFPDIAYQASRMLGQYHEALAGLSGASLREGAADFVATRESLEGFRQAVECDPLGRSQECRREIRFAMDHAHYAPHILTMQEREAAQGYLRDKEKGIEHVLPLQSRPGICMADLKTAFPGYYPHRQLGSVRKAFPDATDGNPLPDPDQNVIFSARLVEAFLGVFKRILLADEFSQLTFSGKLLAYELGIRFLCDHLLGDKSFPVDFPHQNLHRARNQFRLAFRIDIQAAELRRRHRDLELG